MPTRSLLVRCGLLDTSPIVTGSEPQDFLDALTAMARRDRAALVRVATREGLSAQDALECVQDGLCTFLRTWQEGEVAAPREEWGPLLVGIVRNAARNWRRRHAVARPHEPWADEAASDAASADELLVRAEAHVRLRECVEQLCDIQRAVVMLRLLEEQPGEDVAQSLGISRGHVDVLVHRAKSALRTCMLRVTT